MSKFASAKVGLNSVHFFKCFLTTKDFANSLSAPQPTVAVTTGSKVRNFIKYLQENCLDLYTPQQNIAVDKSTVGYKGRILFKTYNPQKPTK